MHTIYVEIDKQGFTASVKASAHNIIGSFAATSHFKGTNVVSLRVLSSELADVDFKTNHDLSFYRALSENIR